MRTKINPPNAALVDQRGLVTPPWYRFFVAIQTDLVTLDTSGEGALILSQGAISGALDDVDADAGLCAAPMLEAPQIDQFGPPLVEIIIPDDLTPPPQAPDVPVSSTLSIRTITGTVSPTPDDYTFLGNATGGVVSVNLPAAASVPGRVLVLKKTDSSGNAARFVASGAETIDGSATLSISTQYQSYTIQSDGAQWWII